MIIALFMLFACALLIMLTLVINGSNGWAVACFVVACGLAWLGGFLAWFFIGALIIGAWSFSDWLDLQDINARIKRH